MKKYFGIFALFFHLSFVWHFYSCCQEAFRREKKNLIILDKSVKKTILPSACRCSLLNCLFLRMLIITRMAPAKASSSLRPYQCFPASTCSPCTAAPLLRAYHRSLWEEVYKRIKGDRLNVWKAWILCYVVHAI